LNIKLSQKTKSKIIKLFLAVVASVLVVVLSNVVMAWLSKNGTVRQSNVVMKLKTSSFSGFYEVEGGGTNYLSIVTNSELMQPKGNQNLTYPDSQVDFYIGIANRADKTTTINTFGIEEAIVKHVGETLSEFDESPNNDGKYLGTQLIAYCDKYTYYTGITMEETKLYYTTSSVVPITNPTKPTLLDSDYTKSKINLLSNLNLNMGSESAAVFHLVVKFVNDENADQNDYINFGSAENGGTFSRKVFFSVE